MAHSIARSSLPRVYQKAFKHRQIVKFLIAGGTGAFVDLSIYYVLTYVVELWYIASSVLSFVAAFWVSFGLQKFWTFRDKNIQKIAKQTTLYFAVAVVNLSMNTLLVYIFVDYAEINKFLSKVLASGIIAIESFLVYRHVIFAKSDGVNIEFEKYEKNR